MSVTVGIQTGASDRLLIERRCDAAPYTSQGLAPVRAGRDAPAPLRCADRATFGHVSVTEGFSGPASKRCQRMAPQSSAPVPGADGARLPRPCPPSPCSRCCGRSAEEEGTPHSSWPQMGRDCRHLADVQRNVLTVLASRPDVQIASRRTGPLSARWGHARG